ncbi:hypothetical protein [Kitasatospora sp. NBC_01300]|uniref:hypothetical protein n=1 Tax=Kitasatospora sp. NBC_01300 TaxID=2903574 RepID=UPI00352DD474|nr:hypothetical protein OG556_30905 [Kitasatospora sp. NBC_01300]
MSEDSKSTLPDLVRNEVVQDLAHRDADGKPREGVFMEIPLRGGLPEADRRGTGVDDQAGSAAAVRPPGDRARIRVQPAPSAALVNVELVAATGVLAGIAAAQCDLRCTPEELAAIRVRMGLKAEPAARPQHEQGGGREWMVVTPAGVWCGWEPDPPD